MQRARPASARIAGLAYCLIVNSAGRYGSREPFAKHALDSGVAAGRRHSILAENILDGHRDGDRRSCQGDWIGADARCNWTRREGVKSGRTIDDVDGCLGRAIELSHNWRGRFEPDRASIAMEGDEIGCAA